MLVSRNTKPVEEDEPSEEAEEEMEAEHNDETDSEFIIDLLFKRRAKIRNERKEKVKKLLGLDETGSDDSLDDSEEKDSEHLESNNIEEKDAELESS